MRKYLLASAIACFSTAAWSDSAVLSPGSHNFTEEGKVGIWTVYADNDRQSCLIEAQDSNGSVVQMGLVSDHQLAYVGVFTQNDMDMKEEGGEVSIIVNGNRYSGTATTLDRDIANGYRGTYIETNNPDFIRDLEHGETLLAYGEDGEGIGINLIDTAKAIEAGKACNAAMAG